MEWRGVGEWAASSGCGKAVAWVGSMETKEAKRVVPMVVAEVDSKDTNEVDLMVERKDWKSSDRLDVWSEKPREFFSVGSTAIAMVAQWVPLQSAFAKVHR
jgi:hypothetical protein